jgi:molecular chaperone Hsp33
MKPMSNPQANPQIAIPSRAPAATTADDTVMPFEVAKLDLRGRVVRLGAAVDEILARHAYPQPVAKLLGEALVLTAMLGSALKIDGRFILQTQSDGPVRMLVVDFTAPDKVRAVPASTRIAWLPQVASGKTDGGALLGKGHLAMTIDQGPDMNRYQGLVALEGSSLEDVAHEYFSVPSRSRRGCAWQSRRNCVPARMVPPTAGAPAASCCNSCRKRPNARESPILIPATRRKVSNLTPSRRTTPGSRAKP